MSNSRAKRLITHVLIDRPRWPRRLRHGSAAASLLGLRVRIPPDAWLSVSCECWVMSGRSICDRPIPYPEESYRVCVRACVYMLVAMSVIWCSHNPLNLQWADTRCQPKKKEECCVMAKQMKYYSQRYLYTRLLSDQASLGRECPILYCSYYAWQRQRIPYVSFTNNTAAPTSKTTRFISIRKIKRLTLFREKNHCICFSENHTKT